MADVLRLASSVVRRKTGTSLARDHGMPAANRNLHGNAPDKSAVALLMVDVINDFDFPEAEQLLHFAMPMARQLAALKQRAQERRVPVIYANDNFGRWRSDFGAQVDHCRRRGGAAKEMADLLTPDEQDYFVLKPKHSGFFSTTLDILLEYLGVETVIVTGIATNICVLFTANDAYLRDFRLCVPRDCVAANTAAENDNALEQMRVVLKADVRPSDQLDFQALAAPAEAP
jgi:nicotinamidase-related amidase